MEVANYCAIAGVSILLLLGCLLHLIENDTSLLRQSEDFSVLFMC